MSNCLDEGLLQAYLDGELPAAQMEAAAQHLGACPACAELAREAEHEYALFATALAPVLSAPPPTEQLRARLEDAIADLQPPRYAVEPKPARLRAWWQALAAGFAFTPRQLAAFATFLLAIALTVALTALRQQRHDGGVQVASSPTAQPNSTNANKSDVPAPNHTDATTTVIPDAVATNNTPNRRAISKPVRRAADQPAGVRPAQPRTPSAQPAPLLPDEKKYLLTIATLDAAIAAQGQRGLPPSLRAEYERNLALVDEAIVATRVAARRNPQDTSVKEFLRSAYQNKIDLLSAVADQTQFVAARD
ncbi:MAG TPA: zf-HC2 domain-containing protein [Pyrinomonadaceae bacterium]|jgi:anti-sigma factor RsiW